jgi:hypothetical protein
VDGLEKEPKKAKDEKKDAKKEEPRKGEKEAKKDPKDGKKDQKEAKKDDKKGEPKAEEGPRINPNVKPVLTLTFGKTAGELVYVKRVSADGSVSRVTVPKSVLDKVAPPQGALAYLDPNVAPFSALDVARLELKVVEGKQERRFVVEREGEKKPEKKAEKQDDGPPSSGWLLLEPKDLKDRPYADAAEVQKVLNDLTRVTAIKYVKKVEPKEGLGAYGLSPPAVTAAVTLKKEGEKEAKTYTYLFGSEATPEKGKPSAAFAVMTGGGELKDILFEVSPTIVATLKNAELRDRTVFRFDPEKVKEVKVAHQGAVEFRKFAFTRKLPDKNWSTDLGVTLDAAKVDELVRTLSNLQALRYVTFTGPAKEHGLTGKPKLKIDVLLEDGKKSYTLTVGSPQDVTGYYAESSTLPGAVLLVSQPRFAGLINDGVGYFSKK